MAEPITAVASVVNLETGKLINISHLLVMRLHNSLEWHDILGWVLSFLSSVFTGQINVSLSLCEGALVLY